MRSSIVETRIVISKYRENCVYEMNSHRAVNGIPITWNRRNVRAIKAELKEFHSCILITVSTRGTNCEHRRVANRNMAKEHPASFFPITSGCRQNFRKIAKQMKFLQNFSNQSFDSVREIFDES